MLPSIQLITEALAGVGKIVDGVTTTDEERSRLHVEMQKVELELKAKALDHEVEIAKARRDIYLADAKGESAIQRWWRPIVNLNNAAIITYCYAISPIFTGEIISLPFDFWLFATASAGITMAGRSAEKTTKNMRLNKTFAEMQQADSQTLREDKAELKRDKWEARQARRNK